jgi:tetratricopeptide (TPR) repeat protein
MLKREGIIAGRFGVSLPAMALAVAIGLLCAPPANGQSFFDNWGRCRNVRIQPEKRVEYCSRLINGGGGANSEIVLFTILGGLHRTMHQYDKAIELYTQALGYRAIGISSSYRLLASPDGLVAALAGRAEVYALTGRQTLALADTDEIFRLAPDTADSLRDALQNSRGHEERA